jgi:hypothetical protein
VLAIGFGVSAVANPASASVTAVEGSAFGYYSDVGLFGGAKQRQGEGQVVCTVPPSNGNPGEPPGCFVVATGHTAEESESPSVALPSGGGSLSDSKPEGATSRYGPAVLFSGQYPNAVNDPEETLPAPPSGPLDVSTQGSTGPNGTVTSSATVSPGTQGTVDPTQPRGVGPGPVVADALSSTCTASKSGITASTTITNGVLVTSTDSQGRALTTVTVPPTPTPNYTRTGTINNVGDSFTVVYNEQITQIDPVTNKRSITVNAVHMYLHGPTAVGDQVIGQSRCGITAPSSSGARYNPVTPARILDTRDGNGAPAVALGPGATLDLQVTGRGGVPATGVSAVVLNVTVTAPSAPISHLTVFPTGQALPLASNLNFVAGETVPNLVVVKLGAGGKVSLFNAEGSVHVIADVAGWYDDGSAASGARYNPVTPARILDTRDGNGAPAVALGPGATLDLQVTGRGGVPATGVSAVVLNVTVTAPSAPISHLTVFPTGEALPLASNLNFVAGQTVPNLVVVKLGTGGKVSLYNAAGSVHVIADVAGWYDAG